MMRMRNLFNPYQQEQEPLPGIGQISPGSAFPAPNIATGGMPFPAMNMAPDEPSYEQEVNSLMSTMYKPETMARDRVNSLIANMPQRPDNISGLRKLGSLIVGMSQGPEAQEKLTFAPYYREMADWKAAIDPAMKAADLERYGNANERQLAFQNASIGVANRRAKVAEDAEKRRLTKAEADIERDKKKNQIAQFKVENPEMELVDDVASGNIFLVHPRTGQKINTGLKHGDLSDLEKEQWRFRNTKYRVDNQGDDNEDPETRPSNWVVRNEFDKNGMPIGTVRVNKVTGTYHRIPNATNPLITDRGFPPTQDQKSMEMRVGEFKNKYPKLSNYVQFDPATGQPVITQPKKIAGYQVGPTEQEYQQILNELYPAINPNQPMGGQFTPPPGAAPGGTWRQLPSGARIYQEP